MKIQLSIARRGRASHHSAFAAVVLIAVIELPLIAIGQQRQAAAMPTNSASLRDRTDQELLELVTGRKLPPRIDRSQAYELERVPPESPLDRFWEMPPRDAAFAFATDHISENMKGLVLKIDDPSAQPPKSGEVGLRWTSGNEYAAPEEGVTILKYDGYKSELLLSQVEIAGRASNEEIESAVMKTDSHRLPPLVAQQTYEILWWLRHIRVAKGSTTWSSGTSSSADDYGRFWMKPDGPVVEKAMMGEPCGQCLTNEEFTSYESFAATLLRRLIERSGIKERYPKPKVGEHVDPDEDAKFLHTPPPAPADLNSRKQWIGRLTDILRNPTRQYLHSQVMDVLVPISDPLRYADERIDAALMEVFRRGLEAVPELERLAQTDEERERDFDPTKFPDEQSLDEEFKRRAEERKPRRETERRLRDQKFNGYEAAAKLGFHDAVAAFPELFRQAQQSNGELPGFNRPLIAAAAIAGRHPELRVELAQYLRQRLSTEEQRTARGTPFLEAVWRGDLRELTPLLEQIAALPRPAPNPNDVRESAIEKASLILMAWRETDALTKAKLDALLTSLIGGGSSIPEVLRAEFAALPAEEQLRFRQFINWMRTAGASVQLHYLENTFTPHTPRPDIAFER